ncbi:MAG: SOS response-associated peptidase [Caldilineaceae bacterium]|nr:SOS response-associated peptidase [Caldilineaceae bacterium]
MCGRFTLHTSPEQIAAQFDVEQPRLADRYNIAPTQPVGIVRLDREATGREWALVHWGLIPSWAKEPSIGARMINARGETVAEKPSFRAAMRRRRCLLPADGFYEWKREGRGKQPYHIRMRSQEPFALAGLWEIWTAPDGSEIQSCTIITTEANEVTSPLHDRMPVILNPEDYEQWLGQGKDADAKEIDQLRHLIRPFDAGLMEVYPVSPKVNSPLYDGPDCIEPLPGPAN